MVNLRRSIVLFIKKLIYQKLSLMWWNINGRCWRCGKKRSSKLPKGVMPDTFGPRVVL
nr:hypothetical protein [Wolbachia endosymbiont (group A) of Apoderus coryli]